MKKIIPTLILTAALAYQAFAGAPPSKEDMQNSITKSKVKTEIVKDNYNVNVELDNLINSGKLEALSFGYDMKTNQLYMVNKVDNKIDKRLGSVIERICEDKETWNRIDDYITITNEDSTLNGQNNPYFFVGENSDLKEKIKNLQNKNAENVNKYIGIKKEYNLYLLAQKEKAKEDSIANEELKGKNTFYILTNKNQEKENSYLTRLVNSTKVETGISKDGGYLCVKANLLPYLNLGLGGTSNDIDDQTNRNTTNIGSDEDYVFQNGILLHRTTDASREDVTTTSYNKHSPMLMVGLDTPYLDVGYGVTFDDVNKFSSSYSVQDVEERNAADGSLVNARHDVEELGSSNNSNYDTRGSLHITGEYGPIAFGGYMQNSEGLNPFHTLQDNTFGVIFGFSPMGLYNLAKDNVEPANKKK